MVLLAKHRRLHRLWSNVQFAAKMPNTHAAAACAGWVPSAASRMACCRAAAGHCAAVSADDCCAERESRKNLEAVSATLVSIGSLVSERLAPERRLVHSCLAPRPSSGRPDTYLFDSVFLI
jgi:hypothetical protein